MDFIIEVRSFVLRSFLPALVLALTAACSKPTPVPEGYRVMGYDAATHEYTLYRNGTFDDKYIVKKMVIRCAMYQWGNREPVRGEDACNLEIGRLYRWAHFTDSKQLDEQVVESDNDFMTIFTGVGADKVSQSFDILSITVLPDKT